ncbi:MAG: hypothetical protein ACJ741_14200 [Pyrinomonadaceae bacterium]
MTNEQHNKLVGVGFLIHGGFQLLMGLLIALMFGSFMTLIPNDPGRPGPPKGFFLIFASFFFIIQAVFALPSFVAAFAVLKHKSWARLSGIIAAVVSAMNFPIGTAVCVYALWFFFGENWKEVYEPASMPGGARAQLRSSAGDAAAWTVNQRQETTAQKYAPPPPPDWR